jgi:hypothetical protein
MCNINDFLFEMSKHKFCRKIRGFFVTYWKEGLLGDEEEAN